MIQNTHTQNVYENSKLTSFIMVIWMMIIKKFFFQIILGCVLFCVVSAQIEQSESESDPMMVAETAAAGVGKAGVAGAKAGFKKGGAAGIKAGKAGFAIGGVKGGKKGNLMMGIHCVY